MTDKRKPITDRYDAVVDLASSGTGVDYAYAIFKLTYAIEGNRCVPTNPEPLLYDHRDESLQPRLQSASDFFANKEKTDVVVQGSAFAPDGQPVTDMNVTVHIGRAQKRILVFGHRGVTWKKNGTLKIEEAQPFVEIPMTYANAYGGLDWRVIDETVPPEMVPVLTEHDHPGMYPRNPFGKGFLVEPGEVPEMAMPHLENPYDLLTAERLIIKDPRLWYRQPLPWCFDWSHPITYPRYLYLDPAIDAWYPSPDDVIPREVKDGYLSQDYRRLTKKHIESGAGPAPMFYQGASHGMIFDTLPKDCPVTIKGMHPTEEQLHFVLPDVAPQIKMQQEEIQEVVATRVHSVVIKPAEKRLSMVFAGSMPLRRKFIPGIHKHIPVSASLDNDVPVRYHPPTPILSQLEEAKQMRH